MGCLDTFVTICINLLGVSVSRGIECMEEMVERFEKVTFHYQIAAI